MNLALVVSLLLGSSAAAWLPHAQAGVVARRGATRALVRAAAGGNDQLVAELRAAKPKEIAEILARNINAIDQRLFLSLADLADATDDDGERDEIARLSSTVASTLETLLSKVRGEVEHPHPYDPAARRGTHAPEPCRPVVEHPHLCGPASDLTRALRARHLAQPSTPLPSADPDGRHLPCAWPSLGEQQARRRCR